jgi:hypothetical protein
MPNFPPNYKEQETYYASQEYQTAAKTAIKENKKLPVYGGPQGGLNKKKKQTAFRRPPAKLYTYPIPQGPSERTGDRLLIKCLEYEPPKATNMQVDVLNAFMEDGQGNKEFIGMDQRKAIANGSLKGLLDQRDPTGQTLMNKDTPMEIRFGSVDGNSRMSAGMSSLLKYMIELPIPQELTDSNSVTWGEDRINALEMAALEVAQGVMATSGIGENAANLANAAVTALNTGISIPGLDSDTQGAVRAAISGAAVGALGSNVSAKSVISRSTGQIMNNNLELLFQGVNLRSFPFTITFSPRDPSESRMVKDIIRRLKQSMAPKIGDKAAGAAGGIFLKSPDVFQLKYLKDGTDHPFLNSFKLAALTGMTVNYTNAGTYTTYEDGTPVNLRMSLTFKELNPIYAEDYMQTGAGPGVGY